MNCLNWLDRQISTRIVTRKSRYGYIKLCFDFM